MCIYLVFLDDFVGCAKSKRRDSECGLRLCVLKKRRMDKQQRYMLTVGELVN